MAKQLKKISIQTTPNGYSLDIDGHGFFYFNEVDLLAGFIAHVGMQETKEMERATLLSGLFASMLGETYNECVNKLKQNIDRLNNKESELAKNVSAAEKKFDELQKAIPELAAKADELQKVIKAAEKVSKKTTKNPNLK